MWGWMSRDAKLHDTIFLAVIIICLFVAGIISVQQTEALDREKSSLEIEILILESENAQLREMLSILRGEQGELRQKIEQWLEQWEVKPVEITGYTLECGYPWADGITFTGSVATEGRTIAVDPAVIPLGSDVYIDGLGWRVAEDIGGAIKGDIVDVYFGAGPEARERALRWGRREALVVIER